jgi:hypothetical protein
MPSVPREDRGRSTVHKFLADDSLAATHPAKRRREGLSRNFHLCHIRPGLPVLTGGHGGLHPPYLLTVGVLEQGRALLQHSMRRRRAHPGVPR